MTRLNVMICTVCGERFNPNELFIYDQSRVYVGKFPRAGIIRIDQKGVCLKCAFEIYDAAKKAIITKANQISAKHEKLRRNIQNDQGREVRKQ